MASVVPHSRIGAALATTSAVVGCCSLVGCWESKRLDFGTLSPTEGRPLPNPASVSANPSASDAVVPPSTAATSELPAPMTTTGPSLMTTAREYVHGKIVDFWGHPVPNVALDVGGVRATTTSDGTFQAADVPEVYDLSFVVHIDGEATETYGWTYQGLTYREVVLPIYRGLPPRRAALHLELPASDGGSLPCGAFALGGQRGHDAFAIYQASTPVSVVWRGVGVLPLNVQSLFWQASDADCKVPVGFLGWRQDDTTLYPGDDVTLTLAGPNDGYAVGTSNVDALLHSDDEGTLTTSLFLRFANGATLPVSSQTTEPGATSSFAVPIIDDATLIVAGTRTGVAVADYGVDYTSMSATAPFNVELRPPSSPQLVQPAVNARLSPEAALFAWVREGDDIAILTVTQHEGFTAQFVVTLKDQVQLPDLSHLGLVLEPDAAFSWSIEVHGAAPTVDEWLEAEFPLDAFSMDFRTPTGPDAYSGRLERSETRTVYFAAQ